MRRAASALLALLLLSGTTSLHSAENERIGIVKSFSGEAAVQRGDGLIKAGKTMRLQRGDVLRTGADGKLGVIFDDDTIIAVGPNSRISIDEFLFRPAENKMSFVARIFTGAISYISGQIARLAPERVRLETPEATIGTRGTHVLINVKGTSDKTK